MDMFNNNNGTFNGLGCSEVPQYPKRDVSYDPLADFCDELLIDEEVEIEELGMKIWKDKRRLKRLKDMAQSGEGRSLLGQSDDDGPESLSPMDMFNNNNGTFNGLGCSEVPQYPKRDVSYDPLADFCDELLIDEEVEIEELGMKIWKDKRRLKRLKDMTQSGEERSLLGQCDDDGPESLSKGMMLKVKDGILRYMLRAMEHLKAQGFVYGIVLENGRTVTGSSDNLREWWKDKVRFDRNGPAAIMKYQNQVKSSDATPKVGDSSAALLELQDTTLSALLSAFWPNCEPPQRHFPLSKGFTPPWWPTGKEDYWNQLPLPNDCRGIPPPYKKPHDLKKFWKVGVLIGVIRHMSSNFENISKIVSQSRTLQERMSSRDGSLWLTALRQEKANIDQILSPLPAFEVNNDCSHSLDPGNSGEIDPLFPEPQSYDVEETNV